NRLKRLRNGLHWRRSMGHREKRQNRKGATRETAKQMPFSSLLVIFAVIGLAVLATSSSWLNLWPKKPAPPTRDSKRSIAVAKDASSAPAVSGNAAATNDTEQSDLDKATDHLNRGTELLAQGKIDEAIAQYQEAVRLSPEDEDMHYNLALALGKQGNRTLAKEHYLEALRIYPDYTEAHNNFGNLLVAEGKYDEAIEHFKAALKLAPDNASAQNNLGTALARQGNAAQAIPYFSEAVRLQPDYVEAHYNLGSAYLT